MMEGRRLLTLRDILYTAFKNKLIIFTVLLTAVVVSLIYCLITPPVYRAETKLLIRMGKAQISGLEQYRPESYNILFQERTQNIRNEIELLKGQYFTEKVIARLKGRIEPLKTGPTPIGQIAGWIRDGLDKILSWLGLSTSPTGPDGRTVMTFLDALHVAFLEDTDMLSVVFDWTDPRFAALAANTYADEYMTQHTLLYESQRSYRFYIDQIALYEKKLKEAEDRLQGFLSDSNIANIALQKELLLRNIADLNNRYNLVAVDYTQAQTKINKIREMARNRKGWIETSEPGSHLLGEHTYLRAVDDSYFKLRTERERLLKFYTPEADEIKTIDDQLDSLRAQKAESLLNIGSMDLSLAQDKKAGLLHEIAIEKKKLDDINSKTLTLTQLERDREIAEQNYQVYKKKAEDLRISDDLDARRISSVKIATPGIPPLTSAYPKKGLIVLFSALAGLLLGFGLSAVHEFFDHTFKNDEDVARVLNIPLLLSVPLQATTDGQAPTLDRATYGESGKLRRLLGLDFRRPVAGNSGLKNGGPGGIALLAIVALGLSGYLVFLQKTATIIHEAVGATQAHMLRPATEQTVSLATIVPAALLEGQTENPDGRETRDSQPAGLTILCDEFESRRVELEKRRAQLEADLHKVSVDT